MLFSLNFDSAVSSTSDIGDRGRELASSFLEEAGYQVLERNYRFGREGVDLVCLDSNRGGEIVFVEVKTRSGDGFALPEASVAEEKRASLIEVARAYLHERKLKGAPSRFDIVGVLLTSEKPEIRHHENAFLSG